MVNTLKTAALLISLTLLLVWFGRAAGGEQGMITAFFFACAMNFVSYWFSDKLVLAAYRAKPISEQESPEIYQIVRELSLEAKIPMPKIYMIPNASPNAFAAGRNPRHAAVAVTQGIFELLNYEELKGVLAHELSHVANRDILISTIAAVLAGAVSVMASAARWVMMFGGMSQRDERERNSNPFIFLVLVILMPVAAALIRLAISRSREYGADEKGAHLCGNPLYLASALRKLDSAARQIPMAQADPASSHLFIVNPLRKGILEALFSTHPPMEMRIARLERMARHSD